MIFLFDYRNISEVTTKIGLITHASAQQVDIKIKLVTPIVAMFEKNKTGTSKVGNISKAQKSKVFKILKL